MQILSSLNVQPGELDAADTALMIQVLERLLNDDSFLDDEIKKEIKQYDNDGNLKIDRAEFQVRARSFVKMGKEVFTWHLAYAIHSEVYASNQS